jgi:hypothetical protein
MASPDIRFDYLGSVATAGRINSPGVSPGEWWAFKVSLGVSGWDVGDWFSIAGGIEFCAMKCSER